MALKDAATFICGYPKSGTSLLLSLLDSHPQLIVYPEETGFFRWFTEFTQGQTVKERADTVYRLLGYSLHWDPRKEHSRQAEFPDRDYSNISFNAIQECYAYNLKIFGTALENLLPAALLAYGEAAGQLQKATVRWVEKTPYNELYAQQIFSYWPEGKCIHVIRDPRDTFASYRQKQKTLTPKSFSHSWFNSEHFGSENVKRYGSNRYLIIRYEDLVDNLDLTLAKVVSFLGIQDDPALRVPTRNGKPWGGNSMFREKFSGVSKRPIGRFHQALSRREILQIERRLFLEMEKFQYDLTRKPTFWMQLQRKMNKG